MTADDIVELVRAAFGDVEPYLLDGGDAVGTDAYPQLRDAHGALIEALRSPAAEIRIAAGYALALIVDEPRARLAQPALDAACASAELPFEQASMILASHRLAASRPRRPEPEFPIDGLTLTPEAARATSPILRAAYTIAQLWPYPAFYRRVKVEIDIVLSEAADDRGPWHVLTLADAMFETVTVLHDDSPQRDDAATPAADIPEPVIPIADADVADPYLQERPIRAPPHVELVGLHDVRWADLEHAYGSAEGVPHMIDALTSPDRDDRRWGFDALVASINHQGSVYSASGPAVRFLVELAARDDVERRGEILRLVAGIAVHDPTWCLVDDLATRASPAWPAVVACAGTIVSLLRDRDEAVRSSAAMVLAFVEPPEGLVDELVAVLAVERSRYVRASLLLSIGYACRRLGSARDAERAVLDRYLDDDCGLIAACAAIGLAQIDRAACRPAIREILARTIVDAPRVVVGPWPWNHGDIAGFARVVRIMVMTTDDLLAEADAARSRGDTTSACDYGTKAFIRAFHDGTHGIERRWRATELDDRQREILRFLIAIAPTEWLPMNGTTCVEAGVSWSLDVVRRLIGDRHGPADAVIDVLDAVLYKLEPEAALDAAFAAIPPADRAAVIDELLRGPYRPWYRRGFRQFTDPAAHRDNSDFTSRFILLIAPHLGELAARRLADEQLVENVSGRRDGLRSTLATLVLARAAVARGDVVPEALDVLVALDRPPISTHRLALREVYALLPIARRQHLLGDAPLYTYISYRDPRGEVRRWSNGRGWDVIDLLPAADIVAKITAAHHEWDRHRNAGDDSHAEPVSGSRTTSLESKPPPDDEFPHARARELLDANR